MIQIKVGREENLHQKQKKGLMQKLLAGAVRTAPRRLNRARKGNDLKFSYQWEPIRDLPEKYDKLASPELKKLTEVWHEHASDLSNTQTLKHFNERLARHWAIETGIIEGIYKIDLGVTELLIEKGIESALIPHGTTDKPAEEIVAILRDHQDVLEGIFDFVASRRPLSTSYIKEMHHALCAHQDEIEAMDSQGRFMRIPLRKGEWKLQPNNPHRGNGRIHQYCPPEHVASEMDRLIAMHLSHDGTGVAPEIEAAWLHHRFSQIHPFQDGNGRVARALATLILLRAGLFPFTVDRTKRAQYISCLETADEGDLVPFVEMLTRSQRRALTKALSLSEELMTDEKNIHDLIRDGAKRLKEKKEAASQDFHDVYRLARRLEDTAFRRMDDLAGQIGESLRSVDSSYDCTVIQSNEEMEHRFDAQAMETAKNLEYHADLRRHHHWFQLRIQETRISSAVVSFHPLGTVFRGVMAVSAFYEERQKEADAASPIVFMPIVSEPFEFIYSEEMEKITARFEKWLHEALVTALAQWRKRM